MKTTIQIDGTRFIINGQPTYLGRTHQGRPIEGLLFNARMVQAIFDDENPITVAHWRYPDTGVWDPDRNTDEFCAALPRYRSHGLLGVTVGLQGGGSVYNPDVYDYYINSAFTRTGDLKPAYFERLRRVLNAADAAGMIVIVNYFYWRQLQWLDGERAILRAVESATDWLLDTGYTNILVDLMNEFQAGDGLGGKEQLLRSQRIHEVIELAKSITHSERRLLVSSSVHPENWQPAGKWPEAIDFYIPHGNSQSSAELGQEIRSLRASAAYQANPRPILINEDSIHLDSLEAAVDEYASWGYYSQGYGAGGRWQHGRFDWLSREREASYEVLSGYQTVPVNWGINTDEKRAFFGRVRELTGEGDEHVAAGVDKK